MLAQDGKLSAASLAETIGITPKAVEKHLAKLKAEGIIQRIGPAKGGRWVVNVLQARLPHSASDLKVCGHLC